MKFYGNPDNGSRNRLLHFGDVLITALGVEMWGIELHVPHALLVGHIIKGGRFVQYGRRFSRIYLFIRQQSIEMY